jgi:DNA-binding IclR family transcriptional regulator
VENWALLTYHARVLLAIAGDPALRLRDVAATLGITERSACAIVTDLASAGYVARHKAGTRTAAAAGQSGSSSSSSSSSGSAVALRHRVRR